MTTTTRSFVYRQRSRESVEHVKRLNQPAWDWDQAMRLLAYHGQPARLCALLRADAARLFERDPQRLERWAESIDLLEWLRPPRRRIPPAFDLEGHVRRHLKCYGKCDSNGELLYGERQNSVDSMLRALIEMGDLSLTNKRAIAAWREAQELCERLEREAAADENMSPVQYRRMIRRGMTALREAMCKDRRVEALRVKLVKKLSR